MLLLYFTGAVVIDKTARYLCCYSISTGISSVVSA